MKLLEFVCFISNFLEYIEEITLKLLQLKAIIFSISQMILSKTYIISKYTRLTATHCNTFDLNKVTITIK